MQYKDYYAVLGIDKKASDDAIKQAYRRLARKYHPDVSKEANAEEKFKDLQEAYEVLKDPEKRTAYDQLGSQWKAGQEFRPPPGWNGAQSPFGGRGAGGGQQFSEEDMGGFSDFFANIFGQGAGRGGQHGFRQRGQDQHASISITLEEAFHGVNRTLQLQMPDQQIRTIKVTIPPGASEGQQLRLAGQGGPGVGGAMAGDLYLKIQIQPNSLFTLHGHDVYLTLPVTPWEAALGADIKVPTLGGAVGLKLAAGSHAGQKLRLKGRGMPGKHAAGDQYAVLQIETPAAHTEEQRQFYETMAKTMPMNPRKNWPV